MKGYYKNPQATAEVIDKTISYTQETWESRTKMGIIVSQDVSKI